MITRYSRPAMRAIWTDENKLRIWLQIEMLAREALVKEGIVPAADFARMKAGGVDVAKHLVVPAYAEDPSRLAFDEATYRDFRDRRVQAIFEIACRVVNPEMP